MFKLSWAGFHQKQVHPALPKDRSALTSKVFHELIERGAAGDKERDLVVGPTDPATNRGFAVWNILRPFDLAS
jgi:hypothetical protein